METETKHFGGGLKGVRYKYIDSDEYYTPIETVEKIFSKILPHVKEKKYGFLVTTNKALLFYMRKS